jgi:xanthine dehydrogenase molybdopterin-binding subunit B
MLSYLTSHAVASSVLYHAGTRHPFQATYKVGFTKDGRVTALDMDLYSNAGEGSGLAYTPT